MIVSGMLLFALLIILASHFIKNDGGKVRVSYDGMEYGTYELNVDNEVEISTDLGINVLKIENGKAYIISATCKDKICMGMHEISNDMPGVIVCLPNKVIVEIVDK